MSSTCQDNCRYFDCFRLELQQATKELVEKEISTRKEEFEEELLEIERRMTHDLDRNRGGPRGDIRDRLDTSKVMSESVNLLAL